MDKKRRAIDDEEVSTTSGPEAVELDVDLYFWLTDRGDVPDDQRNQVLHPLSQRVRLHREHSQRLMNGVYIGKLMHALRKMVIKKSKKPFTLDPALLNLKDQSVVNARDSNWNTVAAELRKFNIKLTKEQKNQIVYDLKQSLVVDVLRQLQEYDKELAARDSQLGAAARQDGYDLDGARREAQGGIPSTSTADGARTGGRPAAAQRASALENNSEINYGGNSNARSFERT